VIVCVCVCVCVEGKFNSFVLFSKSHNVKCWVIDRIKCSIDNSFNLTVNGTTKMCVCVCVCVVYVVIELASARESALFLRAFHLL
jgi:hypothetical protein